LVEWHTAGQAPEEIRPPKDQASASAWILKKAPVFVTLFWSYLGFLGRKKKET
jgi:hypothetical protein